MRFLGIVPLSLAISCYAQNYVIRTAAGGGMPNLSPGTPGGGGAGLALDRSGNIYYVGGANTSVWLLNVSTGLITRVAGNGTPGYGGDGGPALDAQMIPAGIALDAASNLYIADAANQRVRKVSANGVITTVAGNGTIGFSGDNGPAVLAQMNAPIGVAVDSAGNLYIADANNNRIRKVSNGVITTVAGNGNPFLGGDGGPAQNASMNPSGVALDGAGNLYIVDTGNGRIRKVSNGIVTTIAGTTRGPVSFGGDGGPAIGAQLAQPLAVAIDASGSLYIADSANNRIRKVSNGVITTLAGSGNAGGITGFGGFGGDSGPATNALLNMPSGVAVDAFGSVFIADAGNSRIRKVSGGVITSVAGPISPSENLPATSSRLSQPTGVAVDASGALYFADTRNGVIEESRKVCSRLRQGTDRWATILSPLALNCPARWESPSMPRGRCTSPTIRLTGFGRWPTESLQLLEIDVRRPAEVPMCQNVMILAWLGDLRTRSDLGAFPPLVLRCSGGLNSSKSS
jgi:sugar lactone lactonase YvrE